jgi:serine/threonine protein kinase
MTTLTQLGIYTIESHLGGGRFAEVYRGIDAVRRRTAALKALKLEALPAGLEPSSFILQAYLARELVHPYLGWVWETGEEDGTYYLAERYVNGSSLAHTLETSGRIPWAIAGTVIQQVAQGLDFMHARGWAHGDVSARNILTSLDLGAVLTDVGLVIALQSEGGAWYSSPQYRAPELWQGGPPSPAADQYALACVLVEMLTGQAPFSGESAEEMEAKHLEGLDLHQAGGELVPWQATAALQRALDQDPAKRFSSVGEFAETPDRLAATSEDAEERRQRHEAEAQAWRQAEERARNQAEEAARLSALEQARQEVRDQLRLEAQESPAETDQPSQAPQATSQTLIGEGQATPALRLPTELMPQRPQPAARRRDERPRPAFTRYAWVGVLFIALVLTGLWAITRIQLPVGSPKSATPTATVTPGRADPSATIPPSATSSPTPEATASPTPAANASPTLTATSTLRPSLTPTTLPSSTLTRRPSPTPRPPKFIEKPERYLPPGSG